MNVLSIFIALVFCRFFSEFVDREYGVLISPLLSGMFLVLSAVIVFKYKVISRCNRQVFLVTFILLAIAISALFSALVGEMILPKDAWFQVYKYFSYVLLPMVGYVIASDDVVFSGFLKALMSASAIGFIFSIYEGVTGTGMVAIVDHEMIRSLGFSSHPVLLGVQIFVVASFCFIGVHRGLLLKNKNVRYLFYLLLVVSLYFTYARTAWVLFLFVSFGYLYRSIRLEYRVYAFLFFFLFLVMFSQQIASRFLDISTLYDFIVAGEFTMINSYEYIESSMHWRVVQWYGLAEVASNNYIYGVGPAQTELHNDFFLSAHSSLLEFFVEQGAVGGVLFLAFCFRLVIFSMKIKNSVERSLMLYVVLGFVSASFFSISLYNQTFNMMLFLLLVGASQTKFSGSVCMLKSLK